jgi:hypothetical protein
MRRNNIPAELRALPQWVVSNENKIPHNPRTGATASVANPTTWGTFEEACKAPNFKHIGFVLADHNNLTIIDLDDKPDRPASPEQKELQKRILAEFQSYTERSQSGTGYHIIVRGHIPAGVHKDSIEIYSSGRYMICTGDVTKQLPVNNYQGHLDNMFLQMRPQEDVTLVQVDSEISDADIVDMATNASNGEKFTSLCKGDTSGYPGQSEADLAVMSILAFYTKDNEQVMRIFRMTELGKRDKATRNDKYLTYTLKRIRANEAPPIDFPAIAQQAKLAREAPPEPQLISAKHAPIALPPGLVGEVALHFYNASMRPIAEVALASALSFFAGICGRQYYTGGRQKSGLNLYLLLVAPSGVGKDASTNGVKTIFQTIRERVPTSGDYLGWQNYTSQRALQDALVEAPCQISLFGEFGLMLRSISSARPDDPKKSLERAMLDAHSTSGPKSMMAGLKFAQKVNNVDSVIAPAFSFLGECTPSSFYDGLDEGMVASGLIPRFLVMDYEGYRQYESTSPYAGAPIPQAIIDRICEVFIIVDTMKRNGTFQEAVMTPDTRDAYELFEREVTDTMNAARRAGNDVVNELWNRATLNCIRLASLIAVGVNPKEPLVTLEIYQWARSFVCRSVSAMAEKFIKGDVGEGDSKMASDMKSIITRYPQAKVESKRPALAKLHQAGLIPLEYINPRASGLKSFKSHKLGTNRAVKDTLAMLVSSGYLQEVPAADLSKNFGYRGAAYAVVAH